MKGIQKHRMLRRAGARSVMALVLSGTLLGQCTTQKDNSAETLLWLALLWPKPANPICPTSTLTYSGSSSASQSAGSTAQSIDGTGEAEYAPDELLVKMRAGRQFDSVLNDKRLSHFRGKVHSHTAAGDPGGRWVRVRLTKADAGSGIEGEREGRRRVRDAMAELSASSDISTVQPNYIYRSTATAPTDYYFSSQWSLSNSSGPDIDVLPVWNGGAGVTSCSSTTNPSAVVAVVDTGVNYNHQDLSTQMWNPTSSCYDPSGNVISAGCPNHGWDFVDDSSGANDGNTPLGPDNDPMDRNGHGTHVSAILGAKTETSSSIPSTGMAGVCWSAKIMAVRVLSSTGIGYSTAIANGIDFAVQNGAKVINASFGGYGYDSLIYDAIVRARNAGVIVVAAAGNFGTNNDVVPVYPASYDLDNIISVASFEKSGSFSGFSNCGTSSVDVASPGGAILSAYPDIVKYSYSASSLSWSEAGSPTGWKTGASYLGQSGFTDPSGLGTYYADGWNTTRYAAITNGASFVVGFLSFNSYYSLQSNDYLTITANPSSTATPTNIGSILAGNTSGNINSFYTELPLDRTTAANNSYSIGFNFQTNSPGTDEGVFIENSLAITQLNFATNTYASMSGTSMATPHVVGIAALLEQYLIDNGKAASCDYHRVVQAIEEGAYSDPAFLSVVHNGRRIDAAGALNRLKLLCP